MTAAIFAESWKHLQQNPLKFNRQLSHIKKSYIYISWKIPSFFVKIPENSSQPYPYMFNLIDSLSKKTLEQSIRLKLISCSCRVCSFRYKLTHSGCYFSWVHASLFQNSPAWFFYAAFFMIQTILPIILFGSKHELSL